MKKITLIWTLAICQTALGQETRPESFTYGFAAGAVFQSLNIGRTNGQSGGPFVLSDRMGAGAELGLWGQWTLLPALRVRPSFQFSYVPVQVHFWSNDGKVEHRTYPFADAAVPVHLLIVNKFRRIPATGVFLLGGRLAWNLAREPNGAPLQLLPEYLGIDLGLGAGFSIRNWNIQPEFVYTYGMNNLHNFTNGPYDWSVRRIVADRLSLRVLVSLVY